MRSGRQRGFTLIEIMIVVAIIGILAAIAIPAFVGYMRKAKATEPLLQLDYLAKSAKTYYASQSGYPQGTAKVLPGPDGSACAGPGKKIAPSTEWTTDPIWTGLGFRIDEPALFSYHYESTATDAAVVTAVGDLDCDGKHTTFRLDLAVVDGRATSTITRPADSDD